MPNPLRPIVATHQMERQMKYVRTLSLLIATLLSVETVFAEEENDRFPTDLMTFAQGVLPVSVDTKDAGLRTGMEQAIALIDGNPVGFVMTPKPGTAADIVEIVYALPAPTRFDRFAVPNVLETPSPSQTFFNTIEVLGAEQSADGPFITLAQAELTVHGGRGEVTELSLTQDRPEVLWIKLRLTGGVSIEADKTFFEFSELIGNGSQRAAALSERFDGGWKGRGVKIELAQEGPSVSGCYDTDGRLNGTVEGNVLRALGSNEAGIQSQFVLIANEDGALRGLRSTNGAPFKIYDGEPSNEGLECGAPEEPRLGCGAIVHGIGFDFDSDAIRPSSEPVLRALHDGLAGENSNSIQIVGHSSSEGPEDYNRELSERRANSVVAALVSLGLDAGRLSAAGRGEDEPIASNDDEAGRSLNRRVEIVCAS